jgi:hypothetical protein
MVIKRVNIALAFPSEDFVNIFSWLILGHLLADWLLQNDWMAQGKRCGLITLAGLAHFALYTLTTISFLWLAVQNNASPVQYILLGMIIFISHWLIDATDLVRGWMRFYGQRDQAMVRLMIDQTLHLLILGGLALLLGQSSS